MAGIEGLTFDAESVHRLGFRLKFILETSLKDQARVMAGNLASLDPEIVKIHQNLQDLADVVLELVTVLNITLNQKEQGVAPPPKEVASSSDYPMG